MDDPAKSRQAGGHRRQVWEPWLRFPVTTSMVREQHFARISVKYKRIAPFIGNDQPTLIPILDAFASEAVPTVACLKVPQFGQSREKIRITIHFDRDIQWANFSIEGRHRAGQCKSAMPIRWRLRPYFAVLGQKPASQHSDFWQVHHRLKDILTPVGLQRDGQLRRSACQRNRRTEARPTALVVHSNRNPNRHAATKFAKATKRHRKNQKKTRR